MQDIEAKPEIMRRFMAASRPFESASEATIETASE
jgi:hypothetical protein